MYIENKKSGFFLVKKSFKKKFLVFIRNNEITKNNIIDLTNKECGFIFDLKQYKLFESKIYNIKTFKEVIFKSLLLSNNNEILKITKNNNIKIQSSLLITSEKIDRFMKYIFPVRFIYNSNNIEGSKIPSEEVEKIIKNRKYNYKIKNEIKEVENSIETWDFLNNAFIFNESNIKKIYHILTKGLLQENGNIYPRGFKKIENIVNNNITTKPENVSREIIGIINDYRENKKSIFSLQLAFDFHLKYEQIHPFENANGRTGRLIMNKILLQNSMIPIIVFKDNKLAFSNAIASCNSGNYKKYYKFMIEQYKKTLDLITEKTS